MELNPNAASILFPSDAPKAEQPAAADAIRSPTLTLATKPDVRLDSPNPPAGQSTQPTAQTGDDVATSLFGDTTKPEYSSLVSAELDAYTLDAIRDGNTDQADAIKHATRSLASDLSEAGTPAEEFKSAMEIVRQSRQSFAETTPEQAKAAHDAGMLAVAAAGITQADLSSARRFIDHLERKSPGVKASLDAHGAGNDINLIRKAITEAKRRGF
ncbi:hypothetical protein [Rhizobium sp. AB2/73]|uniref:hypothetical protein n=1 Tax=Rhizobium sp. AB2/73 TaxID=2795216 RepID=UPI000DDE65CF|nr:hypothetical protein [Rhizobium sp. AB2/73]QYA11715.1 hypothetical protein J5284_14380 [Rhizobium sp. AB2/73]UEQ82355.1 hypothetical protein I8E17_07625 [Rhizobium sp. AB2/73]